LFYYVCCPVCNQDLSHFVDADEPKEMFAVCTHCQTPLRLKYSTYWDKDMGAEVIFFWFEKVEKDQERLGKKLS